ncbi:MAG: Tat pathway signal protein [Alphaproteobacteria bacterium]|nr:Tat pathway signal protein [Alphaproteobacteria bacterium]
MLSRRSMILGAGAAALAGTAFYAYNRGPAYESVAESVRQPPEPGQMSGLHHLVHYATLAANSHNTQPWLFSGSERQVTIRPDLSRSTPVADSDNHHLFASLGCACENMILAAAASGNSSQAQFADSGDGRIDINFAGGGDRRDPLFDAIPARQCTRSVYDGRKVGPEDLKKLETAANSPSCRMVPLPDGPKIENALELILVANGEQVANPAFAAELLQWLRFSSASAIDRRDGLFSGCSGNPTMPDWLGRLMFGFAFKPQAENDRYAEQIRSSSGLAVFVAEQDDKAHWVEAGRSYQRFALQATALGIRHAFVNQPLEVTKYRPEFANLIGVGPKRPNLIVRYGYAPPMPPSLRRPISDVIV